MLSAAEEIRPGRQVPLRIAVKYGEATAEQKAMITMAGPMADSIVAEHGGAFEPLALKDSRQTAELRRLLREVGAVTQPVSVPIGAIIVANGGAAGDGSKPKAPDTDNGSGKKKPGAKAKQPATNNSGNGK